VERHRLPTHQAASHPSRRATFPYLAHPARPFVTPPTPATMAISGFIHRCILLPLRHPAVPAALVSAWEIGMANWESNDWGSQSHHGYRGGVTLVAGTGWLASCLAQTTAGVAHVRPGAGTDVAVTACS
jgi:hypothetical protein